MKKILLALSLLIATPTIAAQSYGSGNINDAFTATLVAVNDQICYNNTTLGAKLATVQWSVTTAGSGGITVQISKDYGTNAMPGVPYSVRTDAATANPSTAPWANNTPVVGTYETPLPNGATNFCILYQTGGTATAITFSPGKPYVPGSVLATVADLTFAFTVAGSSGALDVSGWTAMVTMLLNNDTGGVNRAFNVNYLADDSTAIVVGIDSTTVNTGAVGKWSIGPILTVPPRRLSVGVGAGTGAGGSTRLVVYARR